MMLFYNFNKECFVEWNSGGGDGGPVAGEGGGVGAAQHGGDRGPQERLPQDPDQCWRCEA